MSLESQDSPLGAFLKALREEGTESILIRAMAAIRQGARLMTVDDDFWVRLPEREYARLLTIVLRQGGTIRARTPYELSDGTQVNAIFQPHGLCSFRTQWKRCAIGRLEGVPLRILPLQRIIARKRAAGREKDLAALPVLGRTLRLAKHLKARQSGTPNPPRKQRKTGSN